MPERPYTYYDFTLSLCPTCLRRVDAKIVFESGHVYMLKTCPEHGFMKVLIAITQLPAALNAVLPVVSAGATPATAPAEDEDDNRGTVKGKVTTADGQPAGSVTVTVKAKGISRSTLTEEDGSFILRNLPFGGYDVEISLTGFATTTQNITVESKKNH